MIRKLAIRLCAAFDHGHVVNADSHPSLRHRNDHAPVFVCLRCKGVVR